MNIELGRIWALLVMTFSVYLALPVERYGRVINFACSAANSKRMMARVKKDYLNVILGELLSETEARPPRRSSGPRLGRVVSYQFLIISAI